MKCKNEDITAMEIRMRLWKWERVEIPKAIPSHLCLVGLFSQE